MFDITCFSIQWLAMLAVGNLSDDEDFVRIARLANIWLNHTHYNGAETIYGEPDRGEKAKEPKDPEAPPSEYGDIIPIDDGNP